MLNEKRIKALVIAALFLIEIFVWTVPAFSNLNAGSDSTQIIGGADGPTAIFVAGNGKKDGAKEPVDEKKANQPEPPC